jgi:hypothetical protein
MGKLEREGKDETAGIVGGRRWRFDCEDWQTETAFLSSQFCVFFSLVFFLALA